jgi:hypothetical protein
VLFQQRIVETRSTVCHRRHVHIAVLESIDEQAEVKQRTW